MLPPLSPDPHGLLPTASGGDSQEFWNALMGGPVGGAATATSPAPVTGPAGAPAMVPLDAVTPP